MAFLMSLQILVSSANTNLCEWTISGISFTNIMNRIGPSTLPWGIPLSTDKSVDR